MNSAGHIRMRLESGRIPNQILAGEQLAECQKFQGNLASNSAKIWSDSWPDSALPFPVKNFLSPFEIQICRKSIQASTIHISIKMSHL